jgi:hypothetical protein
MMMMIIIVIDNNNNNNNNNKVNSSNSFSAMPRNVICLRWREGSEQQDEAQCLFRRYPPSK